MPQVARGNCPAEAILARVPLPQTCRNGGLGRKWRLE